MSTVESMYNTETVECKNTHYNFKAKYNKLCNTYDNRK